MADLDTALAPLRASHERLRALVEPLSTDALTQPSFCDGWTVAQVLSHLGSQSEILSRYLLAARDGTEPPSTDDNPAVWARWDGRSPDEQRAGSLEANAAELALVEGLDGRQRTDLRISLFGGMLEVDPAGYAQLRLNEHAVHTWDVAVALDPTATLAPDATALLLDALPVLVSYMGRPHDRRFGLRVELDGGYEARALVVGDGVTIEPWADQPVDGTLRTTADTLVRLVYGRARPTDPLDLDVEGLTVAELQAVFPGL